MPGASPPLVSIAMRCRSESFSRLDDAHDEQDDEDDDDQTDPADRAATPTRAITVTAAAEEQEYQNQDDQCSSAHGAVSVFVDTTGLRQPPCRGGRPGTCAGERLGGKPRFPS